ncbi:MAG TPA: hypothetical protein VGU45_00345 [Microvirga sp.]|jgi:hypothetical protein|nr:hypothetical protein [Microvirga sp.]
MIRFAALACLAALAACSALPRAVQGVPAGEPWFALPLKEWLGEERAEPEAIAVCRPPECGPGLVAGVVRLAGAEADAAERVLADPGALARMLRTPKAGRPRTAVDLKPLQAGSAAGFAITLARQDARRRPAYGAALGRRSGGDLRVVLVVGEDAGAVEDAARQVAREHLGA